jgi:DNA-binding NarL/FixJ family response regulator
MGAQGLGVDRIRILVVDDHVLFRKGLVNLLSGQEDLEVVGEADEGDSALEKARELMPDIVLMDISMPHRDGLEATKRIKAEMPYVRIVVLTVSEAEEDLFQAIKSGAQGYLLKNLEPEELFNLLRGVQRGEAPISPRMATRILKEFTRQRPQEQAPEDSLTQREREVLGLVVRGATNREIATTLFISENTVKNHLRNILEKLHLQNRVQVVTYALQQGLVAQPQQRDPGRPGSPQ